MKKLLFVALISLAGGSIFGQQISKLKPEDIVSIRGVGLGGQPCGASEPFPEQRLDRELNHLAEIDRSKWLGYVHRSKNVMSGYEKYWSCVTIGLRDERKIIIDGKGFFCLRTKDPKVFYFYQLDQKDFKELSASWAAIKAKEK